MLDVRKIGWVIGVLLLAGCSVIPARRAPTVPVQLFEDSIFGAPSKAVDPAQVFFVSPAMKRYLEVEIAPQLHSQGRQRGLVTALYDSAQLRLDYDTEFTRSAAEAFEARSGNCLSLVIMTAALAKHLQLSVSFQVLHGQESWSRDGDLSLVNGHVNVAVEKRLVDRVQGIDTDAKLELTFGAWSSNRASMLRAVDEQTIVAMFMNNRAAESLVTGQLADAYAYAREAIVQDPEFVSGYNTLGVIYQRRGLAAPAERAFRMALEREADNRPALRNLVKLYDEQGRRSDAAPLYERLARIEREPPFYYFDLGRAAIAAGDYGAARDHLLRELRRDPEYHEFHFWLAIALSGLGDAAGASEQLAQAMSRSTTRRDHAIYAGKLARLQPGMRAN